MVFIFKSLEISGKIINRFVIISPVLLTCWFLINLESIHLKCFLSHYKKPNNITSALVSILISKYYH